MSRLSPSETAEILRWSGITEDAASTDTGLAEAIVRAFAAHRPSRASEDFPAIRAELRLHAASQPQSDQSEAA